MPALEDTTLASHRPTETWTAVAGAIVTLVIYAFGITDSNVIAALPIIVGALPAGVTWFVDTQNKKKAPDKQAAAVKQAAADSRAANAPLKKAVKRLDAVVERLEDLEPSLHTVKAQTEVHSLEDELRQIENSIA